MHATYWISILALSLLFSCASDDHARGTSPATTTQAPNHAPLVLVAEGKPMATIVIPKDEVVIKSRGLRLNLFETAARELAHHVELATGARLPVVTEGQQPKGTCIYLTGVPEKHTDMPLEGFEIKTGPDTLTIKAPLPPAIDPNAFFTKKVRLYNKKRKTAPLPRSGANGILYGVYDFLEQNLGARWYYPGPDGFVIDKTKDLTLTPTHYTDHPARVKRTWYTGQIKGVSWSKKEQALHDLRYRAGSSSPAITANHTPFNFEVHREKHPECFELKKDGTRSTSYPCYGHPKTVDLFMADLEALYTRGEVTPWVQGNRLRCPPSEVCIPFMPPDKAINCFCDHCKKIFEPEKRHLGRASKLLATFVSKLAHRVKEKWPDKFISYGPYSNWTDVPDGVTFPGNVRVGICMMRGAANYKEPEVVADHQQMIDGWYKLTGHKVYLWEYACWPTDCTALPFQYPGVNRDFQQQNTSKIEGTFINGGAGPPNLAGSLWAYQHPTFYCWFKSMWDPKFDVDSAMAEYVRRMYGPAQDPMGKLFDLLRNRWEKVLWETMPKGHRISPRMVHEETMPRSYALKLKDLAAQARTQAGPKGLYRRKVDFFCNAIDLFMEESDNYHEGGKLPELPILRTGGKPIIDGKLDDPVWQDATAQAFVMAADKENPSPKQATWVKAIWDRQTVTFGFHMTEPNMKNLKAQARKRDQAGIWWDDCIELFLDTKARREDYLHLIINSDNVVWDQRFKKAWDCPGMKTAVHKGKDFWSLEIQMPLSSFPEVPTFKSGKTLWYGNFIRNRPASIKEGDKLAAFQRWSTLHRRSHHDFSAFGKLKFVE